MTATQAAVGTSIRRNAHDAGREAADLSIGRLGSAADLVLLFGTSGHDQGDLLSGVAAVTGDTPMVGASGEGVIDGDQSLERDHAVSVMAIASDRLRFETISVAGYPDDPAGAGRALAERAGAVDDAVALVVFPDGLHGDASLFLRALRELQPGLTVFGGTSADAMQFRETWQYVDGVASTASVAAVLIRGQGRVQTDVGHGCAPIGRRSTITAGDGTWLAAIDDRPAWSVFKEYLDGEPHDLTAEGIIHLCVGLPRDDGPTDDDRYVVRTPLALDKDRGALYFPGGGLQTGTEIQMLRRDPVRIRASAIDCARRTRDASPDQEPAFVLQIECAGRGRVLFGSSTTDQVIRPMREAVGEDVPWIGFHAFGEIAPRGDGARYHNYTVVLGAFYDTP